ncbi:MAG: SH3 domain-containing protein [Bacillota bacterium]|jgi:hypothetical protein
MDETVAELLEREEDARQQYHALIGRLPGGTGRQLLERILTQKRFEIETLKLLKSGKVPDTFIGFGTITDDDVNFRESPSPQAYVLSVLQKGTPVILTEKRGNWTAVQLYDGRLGWVFRDYVRGTD